VTESRRPKDAETHIGNHKLDPSTLMMGYGFDPALSEGSLKPPIFLTSTFVFETAAEGKRFFEGITNKHGSGGKAEGLVLFALQRPNQEILEDRLKIWEDAEASLTFSSGMTAIAYPAARHLSGPAMSSVHSGPLYAATETIINKILTQFWRSLRRLSGRSDARRSWTR
jgi:methionine-gamma-lyase